MHANVCSVRQNMISGIKKLNGEENKVGFFEKFALKNGP